MNHFSHPKFLEITIKLLNEAANKADLDTFLQQESIDSLTELTTSFDPSTSLFETTNKQYFYGIWNDNQLVGIINWLEEDEKELATIKHFILDAQYRYVGLANLLYDALEKTAMETGITTIQVAKQPMDKASLVFWDKHDYVSTDNMLTKKLS